jgi:hypothetical protein
VVIGIGPTVDRRHTTSPKVGHHAEDGAATSRAGRTRETSIPLTVISSATGQAGHRPSAILTTNDEKLLQLIQRGG